MMRQMMPQRRRCSLIEEDAHLRWSEGAARRVFKHGAHLLERDAGEPFDKLPHRRPIFKILKECNHRHSGPAKHPGATDALRVTLYCFARGPVDHDGDDSTPGKGDGRPGARLTPLGQRQPVSRIIVDCADASAPNPHVVREALAM